MEESSHAAAFQALRIHIHTRMRYVKIRTKRVRRSVKLEKECIDCHIGGTKSPEAWILIISLRGDLSHIVNIQLQIEH